MQNTNDIKKQVRARYANAVQGESGCCDTGGGNTQRIGRMLGYTDSEMARAPGEANLGLGCGNPLSRLELKPGMTVLDLGSGAGFDAFLAARAVGPDGLVIGVDMTPEMIAKANQNAAAMGDPPVEFRLGEIENLPVADGSVDAVISNCVINLSPDKRAVFREIFRVLRPGGQAAISDVLRQAVLPDAVKQDPEAYCG